MARYDVYGVGVGASKVAGVTANNIVTGTEVRGEPAGGDVYARTQSIVAQKPRIDFTTRCIAQALAACGLTGSSIADMSGGLCAYAYAHEDGGTRDADSVHRKYSATKGILVPASLRCEHQADAEISYEGTITYDDENDPIVVTASVAAPSGYTDDERFSLGGITVGDISIGSVRSLEINFGVNVASEGADSNIWDDHASITTIVPVITIRGIDPAVMGATGIPLAGKAATHANTTIYLRKRADGGTFVANGESEHISITAAGLAHISTPYGASPDKPGEVELVLNAQYDGSNDPLVINTADSIS